MKKMKCLMAMFLLFFSLSFLFVGCQEIENQDPAEKQMNQETSIIERIDLSKISAPQEAAVYSVVFFDREPEEIAHIFLGDDFEEGETAAVGRMFVKDAETKK